MKQQFSCRLAALLAAAAISALPPFAFGAEGQVLKPANVPKIVDPTVQGEENAVLTQAPNVPPPITRKHE